MPILYVHGVAIRQQGENGWDAVKSFLTGLDWPPVQTHLRKHIAPVLNPTRPQQVVIEQAFWGDLGAAPRLSSPLKDDSQAPAQLSTAALANALEEHVRDLLPLQTWPQVIEVTAYVAGAAALRPQWAGLGTAEQQWQSLLHLTENELRARHPLGVWPLLALRQDVQTRLLGHLSHLRGPLESFLPYFMGDVMGYPLQRGPAGHPGPIPQRILAILSKMQALKRQTGEPIVVLTHSMGGQLMYDVLSAYAPASPALQDLQVDFWAAAASQLGLFASLNLFVNPVSPQGTLPPLTNLGYLWNVWSPTDFLSFQAGSAVGDAHDIPMALTDDVFKAHMAYITTPLFYEIFASKLRAEVTPLYQ